LERAKRIDPTAEWRWMKEMQLFPINLIFKKVVSMASSMKKSPEGITGISK
jgi:hypothetical protein